MEAVDIGCFLWALEMVLDEIRGENRIKARIFRLGRLKQICQQKRKRVL